MRIVRATLTSFAGLGMAGFLSVALLAGGQTVGIGYMIAPAGAKGSNTDPYAMAPAADNQWTLHQPHLMILVPDLKTIDGLSTDPNNGGPYVMWKGTPYAHIMAPITGPAMTMTSRSGK